MSEIFIEELSNNIKRLEINTVDEHKYLEERKKTECEVLGWLDAGQIFSLVFFNSMAILFGLQSRSVRKH